MTDLVKRLRERDAAGGDYCTEWGEAADRIEKDAQHIDEMYELVAAMNADHTASKTSIDKLEAALREITSVSKVYVANGEDMAQALTILLASHRKIALAALEGKDG